VSSAKFEELRGLSPEERIRTMYKKKLQSDIAFRIATLRSVSTFGEYHPLPGA
jgi:hypothetical protein